MGTPCQKRDELLNAYKALLEANSEAMTQYTDAITQGLGYEIWAILKEELVKSQKMCKEIRKLYADHVREHGCGGKPEE